MTQTDKEKLQMAKNLVKSNNKKINDLLAKQNEVSVLKSQMSEIQEHIKNLKA